MAIIKTGTYRFNDVLTQSVGGYLFNGKFNVTTTLNAPAMPEYGFEGYIGEHTFECTALYQEPSDSVIDETFIGGISYRLLTAQPALPQSLVDVGVVLPTEPYVYSQTEGWGTWRGEGMQTITITEDTEVSEEFSEWFTINTVAQKQISGAWKFKEFSLIKFPEQGFIQVVEFKISCAAEGTAIDVYCSQARIPNAVYKECNVVVESMVPDVTNGEWEFPCAVIISAADCGWRHSDFGVTEGFDSWDFGTEPQYVSVKFYNWLLVNTIPTAFTVKEKMNNLIAKANAVTGKSDADLTSGVNSLIEGYRNIEKYNGTVSITTKEGA